MSIKTQLDEQQILQSVYDPGTDTLSVNVSGGISVGSVNQGTPNTVANGWPVKITDGTDTAQVTAGGLLQVDGSGVTQPVSGTVTATISAPSTLLNNKVTVTTAGTRVALAGSTSIKSVSVKALSTNTGKIYLGNSTVASTNGMQLDAGDSATVEIDNLSKVFIDSDVNGEGVTYLAS